MIPKDCKRLAEVDFPIAEVSRHAAREKAIRHGHPSTLHLWWARRPLPACLTTSYWDERPELENPIKDPARFERHEVSKAAHYYVLVHAVASPMIVREDSPPYGGKHP